MINFDSVVSLLTHKLTSLLLADKELLQGVIARPLCGRARQVRQATPSIVEWLCLWRDTPEHSYVYWIRQTAAIHICNNKIQY